MTDKQIIDEVDVSKCKYNNNGWCLLSESCDAIRYRSCGDMTLFDCYYRNWQRKEQECEELKEEVQEALKKNAENYHNSCSLQKEVNQLKAQQQLDQLKAENEELKKQLEEESKLGHKAIQDEANTFYDLLKIQKELGYLKEALEKEFITYRLDGFVPVFTYKGYELDKLIGKNNQLKAENKHLNDLLNQALKELEQSREAIEKIKEIAEKNLNIHTCAFKGCGYDLITKQILQICDEVKE